MDHDRKMKILHLIDEKVPYSLIAEAFGASKATVASIKRQRNDSGSKRRKSLSFKMDLSTNSTQEFSLSWARPLHPGILVAIKNYTFPEK